MQCKEVYMVKTSSPLKHHISYFNLDSQNTISRHFVKSNLFIKFSATVICVRTLPDFGHIEVNNQRQLPKQPGGGGHQMSSFIAVIIGLHRIVYVTSRGGLYLEDARFHAGCQMPWHRD